MDDSQELRKDFLTAFYTRESLVRSINKLRTDYESFKKAFSILLIDIDHFKTFNDKHGHLLGDEILKYFSSSIRLDLIAEQTTLFRFGGDELLVLFHAADSNEAYALAVRLLENVKRRPCNLRGVQLKMSFSGGIASYPRDGLVAEDLLEKADKALYCSKRNGPGQITQYHKAWIKKMKLIGMLAVFFFITVLFGLAVQLNFMEKLAFAGRRSLVIAKEVGATFAGTIRRAKEVPKKAPGSIPPPVFTPIPRSQRLPETIPGFPEENPPLPRGPVDRVTLKNGGVVQGRIVAEDKTHVTIQLEGLSGRGVVVLKK